LRLYVGTKGIDANGDGSVDFLERNGLRGGSVYYFTPESGASRTDLPNGAVTGAWSASTTYALRETKLEDVHTNPVDGRQLVLADQTDGVYRLTIALQFVAGEFDPSASATTIQQIDALSPALIGAPDNLVWSRNGRIFVQEDGGGNEMWQIHSDGGGHIRIAQAFSEPSGIIDASEELGFLPGSVLLSSIQGTSAGGGAQLAVLISPTANVIARTGDYNENGVVDAADYTVWRDSLGQTGPGLAADGNLNNQIDAGDYVVWKAHFGQSALSGAAGAWTSEAAVPEPDGVTLLLISSPLLLQRFAQQRRRHG
jgi:hypothetical protein